MSRKKAFLIFIHSICWLFFATIPPIIFHGSPFRRSYSNTILSPSYLIFVFSFVFLFYLTTDYLIPQFYLKKKYFQYFGSMFLVFVAYFFLKPFELMWVYNAPSKDDLAYNPFGLDIISTFTFLVIISIGIALQIIRQWRLSELQAQRAETEKTQAVVEKKTAELSFLKAQINPHFLFNTLNTIYSLIRTQNPLAGDAVLKLSHIMRFVTDDASSDFVSLEKEVAFVTDFVKLHQLQLGKKVDLDFSVTGNTKNKKIAPLILMTYLENVFKYGISNHETAPIMIRLNITEKSLDFFCQNRIFATPRAAERTGIGLTNTKKRLEHLYPGTHTLNINHTSGLYTVTLTLPA